MMKERLEMKRSYLGEKAPAFFIEKGFGWSSFCSGRGFLPFSGGGSLASVAASEQTPSVTKTDSL